VTLADTATGTWSFMANAAAPGGDTRVEASGPIIDGHMVPEPATLLLLSLGTLAAIRRQRW